MVEESVNELSDPRTEKLKEANISLIINNYNDIFSSFDPRSYLERALSDDFIQECKRAARDKEEGIELRILVPKKARDIKEEWKIKKRLRDHFNHHQERLSKEIFKVKKGGIGWIITGTIAIIAAVLIRAFNQQVLLDSFIEPILVIPGWFLIWEGLNRVLVEHKKTLPEFEFYRKMTRAEINFAEF